jgi:hypothetical protein
VPEVILEFRAGESKCDAAFAQPITCESDS